VCVKGVGWGVGGGHTERGGPGTSTKCVLANMQHERASKHPASTSDNKHGTGRCPALGVCVGWGVRVQGLMPGGLTALCTQLRGAGGGERGLRGRREGGRSGCGTYVLQWGLLLSHVAQRGIIVTTDMLCSCCCCLHHLLHHPPSWHTPARPARNDHSRIRRGDLTGVPLTRLPPGSSSSSSR